MPATACPGPPGTGAASTDGEKSASQDGGHQRGHQYWYDYRHSLTFGDNSVARACVAGCDVAVTVCSTAVTIACHRGIALQLLGKAGCSLVALPRRDGARHCAVKLLRAIYGILR